MLFHRSDCVNISFRPAELTLQTFTYVRREKTKVIFQIVDVKKYVLKQLTNHFCYFLSGARQAL